MSFPAALKQAERPIPGLYGAILCHEAAFIDKSTGAFFTIKVALKTLSSSLAKVRGMLTAEPRRRNDVIKG